MGTWGTGISSNDVYEDINDEFFELYNQGKKVSEITKKLISENQELIDSREDQNNFWIAMAKAQWECKALDPKIYNQVREIIESDIDIELWKELDASKPDITKRRKVLIDFLAKISVEKKNAKRIIKKKFRNAIFEKGDCLTFKLSDGDYCGVFVLESEKNTEFGLNLIAITDLKSKQKLSVKDFEKANILFEMEQQINSKYTPEEQIHWYHAQFYKKSMTKFEVIGKLDVNKAYSPNNDFQRFSNWDNIVEDLDAFYSDFENNKCKKNMKLRRMRKKTWL